MRNSKTNRQHEWLCGHQGWGHQATKAGRKAVNARPMRHGRFDVENNGAVRSALPKSPSCPIPCVSRGGTGTGVRGADSKNTQFLAAWDNDFLRLTFV